MDLLKFIPIKLTLCLILGILLGYYSQIGLLSAFLFSTALLITLAIFFPRKNLGRSSIFFILMALTTLSIGMVSVSLKDPSNFNDHFTNHNPANRVQWRLKIRDILKATTYSRRYIAEVQYMDQTKAWGKLLLVLPLDAARTTLAVDDELLVYGVADEVKPPLNPDQFNYRAYLKGLGIMHQMRFPAIVPTSIQNSSWTFYGQAASFRATINTKLQQADFGTDELGIIQALLLGERADISEATYTNYRNAGAVHILAISGLHIGILLLLLQWALRPLDYISKGKTIKLVVIVLCLWTFAFLAGLSASVVRAVTMFSFVAYALYLNRPRNTYNILALSMFFILLLFDPLLLFQVGFQMSYTAVFAIVWLYPLFLTLWTPKNGLLLKLWQLVSVSIAAQLGVLPLSLFYFHQFPGLFLISNLLIVPILGLILGLGILVIIMALGDFLPELLVKGYNLLIGTMNHLIEWVAEQETFLFKHIAFDGIQMVLAYAIIIGMGFIGTRITFKRVIFLSLAVIGFQSWTMYTVFRAGSKESLLLAHQTKNTVIAYRSGQELILFGPDSLRADRMTREYRMAEHIQSISFAPLQNYYTYRGYKVLVLDSLGIVPSLLAPPDYLVLTKSPKINLNRLISTLQPKMIVADGSNYRSSIERWKTTCAQRRVPFHYTGENGAFFFGED